MSGRRSDPLSGRKAGIFREGDPGSRHPGGDWLLTMPVKMSSKAQRFQDLVRRQVAHVGRIVLLTVSGVAALWVGSCRHNWSQGFLGFMRQSGADWLLRATISMDKIPIRAALSDRYEAGNSHS
jgi:hypothetical protein